MPAESAYNHERYLRRKAYVLAYYKNRRQKRKAEGRCPLCNDECDTSFIHCSKCLDRMYEWISQYSANKKRTS